MKNWSRLILPLGLGVLATVINASAMTNRLAPMELVAVNRKLNPGEKFAAKDLVKVEVGYPSSHLNHHFWTWAEREALLQHVGTPTQLEAGDLVPRHQYRDYGRNVFVIPEDSVLIGFQFHESAMKQQEKHLLIPGRNVHLEFLGNDTGRRGLSAKIVFLEPIIDSQVLQGAPSQYYQMGVIVKRDEENDVRTIGTVKVNNIVGLSGDSSAK